MRTQSLVHFFFVTDRYIFFYFWWKFKDRYKIVENNIGIFKLDILKLAYERTFISIL